VFKAFGHPSPTGLSAVGLHINALRRNAGITQGEMASKVGVTRAAISKAEMGKKIVNEVAPLIYDFFEVPASERLPHEDNQYTKADAFGEAVPEGEPSLCLGQ
jgi:DNA-binding XRE family transcriptional regulator